MCLRPIGKNSERSIHAGTTQPPPNTSPLRWHNPERAQVFDTGSRLVEPIAASPTCAPPSSKRQLAPPLAPETHFASRLRNPFSGLPPGRRRPRSWCRRSWPRACRGRSSSTSWRRSSSRPTSRPCGPSAGTGATPSLTQRSGSTSSRRSWRRSRPATSSRRRASRTWPGTRAVLPSWPRPSAGATGSSGRAAGRAARGPACVCGRSMGARGDQQLRPRRAVPRDGARGARGAHLPRRRQPPAAGRAGHAACATSRGWAGGPGGRRPAGCGGEASRGPRGPRVCAARCAPERAWGVRWHERVQLLFYGRWPYTRAQAPLPQCLAELRRRRLGDLGLLYFGRAVGHDSLPNSRRKPHIRERGPRRSDRDELHSRAGRLTRSMSFGAGEASTFGRASSSSR